jgi:hypothetical protein
MSVGGTSDQIAGRDHHVEHDHVGVQREPPIRTRRRIKDLAPEVKAVARRLVVGWSGKSLPTDRTG